MQCSSSGVTTRWVRGSGNSTRSSMASWRNTPRRNASYASPSPVRMQVASRASRRDQRAPPDIEKSPEHRLDIVAFEVQLCRRAPAAGSSATRDASPPFGIFSLVWGGERNTALGRDQSLQTRFVNEPFRGQSIQSVPVVAKMEHAQLRAGRGPTPARPTFGVRARSRLTS